MPRERIYGFSFLNCNGQKQTFFENDFNTRKEFLKERARFKRRGVSIHDMKTTKPYNNPNKRKKK